jgi:hypothetical protein
MLDRPPVLAVVLVLLAGCARATLPYRPEPQPAGATVSAAYQLVGDQVRIEIDTDGRRLEQVWIVKPDGTALAPRAVELAPVVTGPPSSIGVGVGGGSGGFGTGLSIGFPIGAGASRTVSNTIAWFPPAAGPPPWRLHVKLADTAPATFVVGGPPPS